MDTTRTVHELKVWPRYFPAVASGSKPFEVRRDDRPFVVGDELELREYDPDSRAGYTGPTSWHRITYVLRGPEAERSGLQPGYCVLGLAKIR